MNRSRKGSQRHPGTTGTVAASLAILLLLILVFGATKPTRAQAQGTVTPAATPTVTTTNTATSTWTVTVTLAPTTTRTPTASPTASPSAAPSATLVPPTFTPTASPSATAERDPCSSNVYADCVAFCRAQRDSCSSDVHAYRVPEPSATPFPAPTAAPTLIASTEPAEPDGGNLPGVLLGAVALVALIAAVVIAVLILRKRRGPAVPSGTPTPPSGGPQLTTGGEPSMAAVLTTLRPLPGVPFLESQGRPAGILYFPLSKPAISVGRAADNDLVIDGSFAGWQTVSRHHATLEYDGSRVVVVGRETPNGIQVNSQRTGSSVLHDGWTVSFGQVKFVFRDNQGGGA